jgi:hypothetical protein
MVALALELAPVASEQHRDVQRCLYNVSRLSEMLSLLHTARLKSLRTGHDPPPARA